MDSKRTKSVSCMLTPEEHRAFKIACAQLGISMDRLFRDTVAETIVRASLTPAAMAQKGDGDG